MAEQRGEHETTLLAMRDPESEEDHFATLSYIGKVLDDMGPLQACKLSVAELTSESVVVISSPKKLSMESAESIQEAAAKVFPDNRVIMLSDGLVLGITKEESDG